MGSEEQIRLNTAMGQKKRTTPSKGYLVLFQLKWDLGIEVLEIVMTSAVQIHHNSLKFKRHAKWQGNNTFIDENNEYVIQRRSSEESSEL
jgi:hypothetical protein